MTIVRVERQGLLIRHIQELAKKNSQGFVVSKYVDKQRLATNDQLLTVFSGVANMGQELVKKEPGLLQQLLGKYVQQFLSLAGLLQTVYT